MPGVLFNIYKAYPFISSFPFFLTAITGGFLPFSKLWGSWPRVDGGMVRSQLMGQVCGPRPGLWATVLLGKGGGTCKIGDPPKTSPKPSLSILKYLLKWSHLGWFGGTSIDGNLLSMCECCLIHSILELELPCFLETPSQHVWTCLGDIDFGLFVPDLSSPQK